MVQLRYFASLRETLGIGSESIALPGTIETVADLEQWLQQRGAPWDTALAGDHLLVAVNQVVSKRNTAVSNGDEIAWFPPVTGG
jgi:molybdopterin synthase sulfur carrier subunit